MKKKKRRQKPALKLKRKRITKRERQIIRAIFLLRAAIGAERHAFTLQLEILQLMMPKLPDEPPAAYRQLCEVQRRLALLELDKKWSDDELRTALLSLWPDE